MARRIFQRIGTRLTFWGTAVTFLVCFLIAAVLYAGVFFSIRGEVDAFIEGEVYEFVASANAHLGDYASLQEEFRQELGARTLDDLAFRMYDLSGRLILTSEADDPIAPHWTGANDIPQMPTFESFVPEGSSRTFRLCSKRITLNNGQTCIAQASYSLDRMLASMSEFRRIALIALLLSVVISLAAGRFLAGRSLKPIKQITQDAKSITLDRLNDRITMIGTGDEWDQLAQVINGLLERTERYVSQLRQFTADASHEIRTPLTALRGQTELALSREQSAEELRHVLEENIIHFERLQRLAEDLLLITRLDAGEPILKTTQFELSQLIESAVELYRPLAEEHGILLTAGQMPSVSIKADGARIRQLLCNLIDNAIKYTPWGGKIKLSMEKKPGRIHFAVSDTGIGIPPDSVSRVFDRFYRADQARSTRDRAGAGLGLSICRSIALAHHGDIRVSTELGRGSTFEVTLPLADD